MASIAIEVQCLWVSGITHQQKGMSQQSVMILTALLRMLSGTPERWCWLNPFWEGPGVATDSLCESISWRIFNHTFESVEAVWAYHDVCRRGGCDWDPLSESAGVATHSKCAGRVAKGLMLPQYPFSQSCMYVHLCVSLAHEYTLVLIKHMRVPVLWL